MNTLEENVMLSLVNNRADELLEINKYKIEWSKMEGILNNHKLLPYFYQDYNQFVPHEQKEKFEDLYNIHCRKINEIYHTLSAISAMISDENLNAVIIKGIVLSNMLHNNLYTRSCSDIDILIDIKDVSKMHTLLIENGYFHACGKRSAFDFSDGYRYLNVPMRKDYDHHEYFEYYYYYEKDKYIKIELQVSIHKSIILPELIREFMSNTEEVTVKDLTVVTLNKNHTLLYLLESAYNDAEWFHRGPRLNKYLDIYLLTKSMEVNWDEILILSYKYSITLSIQSALKAMNEIFDDFISEDIISKFSSPNNMLQINWEIGIKERLFEENQLRQNRLLRNLKQICYSESNINWSNPLHVQDRPCLMVSDAKYNFNNKCYIDGSAEDTLTFILQIDPLMMNNVEDYQMVLNFIDPTLDSNEFYAVNVEISFEFGYYIQMEGQGNVEHKYDLVIKDNTIEIKIPKKSILTVEGKAAFSIMLKEKVHEGIFHWLSPYWFGDKNIWRTATLLKL